MAFVIQSVTDRWCPAHGAVPRSFGAPGLLFTRRPKSARLGVGVPTETASDLHPRTGHGLRGPRHETRGLSLRLPAHLPSGNQPRCGLGGWPTDGYHPAMPGYQNRSTPLPTRFGAPGPVLSSAQWHSSEVTWREDVCWSESACSSPVGPRAIHSGHRCQTAQGKIASMDPSLIPGAMVIVWANMRKPGVEGSLVFRGADRCAGALKERGGRGGDSL